MDCDSEQQNGPADANPLIFGSWKLNSWKTWYSEARMEEQENLAQTDGEIEKIPLDILEPIANALQTTPHELMGWDENQSVSEQQLELLLDDDINEIFIDFKSLS